MTMDPYLGSWAPGYAGFYYAGATWAATPPLGYGYPSPATPSCCGYGPILGRPHNLDNHLVHGGGTQQVFEEMSQPYGLHSLECRNLTLADGTIYSYVALPADYPLHRATPATSLIPAEGGSIAAVSPPVAQAEGWTAPVPDSPLLTIVQDTLKVFNKMPVIVEKDVTEITNLKELSAQFRSEMKDTFKAQPDSNMFDSMPVYDEEDDGWQNSTLQQQTYEEEKQESEQPPKCFSKASKNASLEDATKFACSDLCDCILKQQQDEEGFAFSTHATNEKQTLSDSMPVYDVYDDKDSALPDVFSCALEQQPQQVDDMCNACDTQEFSTAYCQVTSRLPIQMKSPVMPTVVQWSNSKLIDQHLNYSDMVSLPEVKVFAISKPTTRSDGMIMVKSSISSVHIWDPGIALLYYPKLHRLPGIQRDAIVPVQRQMQSKSIISLWKFSFGKPAQMQWDPGKDNKNFNDLIPTCWRTMSTNAVIKLTNGKPIQTASILSVQQGKLQKVHIQQWHMLLLATGKDEWKSSLYKGMKMLIASGSFIQDDVLAVRIQFYVPKCCVRQQSYCRMRSRIINYGIHFLWDPGIANFRDMTLDIFVIPCQVLPIQKIPELLSLILQTQSHLDLQQDLVHLTMREKSEQSPYLDMQPNGGQQFSCPEILTGCLYASSFKKKKEMARLLPEICNSRLNAMHYCQIFQKCNAMSSQHYSQQDMNLCGIALWLINFQPP